MTATYPPNLQTIISLLLFCVSKFKIFDFFLFVFVKMEPYGRKISNDISHLKVHMRFTPKISCIVSTKVLQRIVKFEILDFCPPHFFFFFFFFFLFVFVNMGPYAIGRKKWNDISCESTHQVQNSNDISCESTHQIHFQRIMHTYRDGLYQSC